MEIQEFLCFEMVGGKGKRRERKERGGTLRLGFSGRLFLGTAAATRPQEKPGMAGCRASVGKGPLRLFLE